MKWFLDQRTMVKLALSFAVMAVLLAAVGWVSLDVAADANAALTGAYQRDMVAVDLAGRAQIERLNVAKAYRQAMLEPDETARAASVQQMDEAEARYGRILDELDTLTSRPEQKSRIVEARKGMVAYGAAIRPALEAYRTDHVKGHALLLVSTAIGVRVGETLDAYIKAKHELAQESHDLASAQYVRGRTAALGLTIGAIVFAVIVAFVVGGSISKPLKAAVEVLERVAEGDLTARLELDRQDEVGTLAKALNQSLEAVRATLAGVQDVSVDVAAVSTELAASAQQISSGAQEQAASLEETAASLEEISSTVKQNTDNARHAAELASSARDAAERGGEVVGSAVSAMNEITRSSKKIADIITTIDEIAFQTNLLALNAAVEAARAGEQGRGFGVVAAEVRSLAQRTGSAAKEIRGLIADSSSKVEVGTRQVNESGETLEEIVRSVKMVTDMVAEIAAASREQNSGIEQVNTAVTQVDQVTQLNAAQTEELSATATALSEKSSRLQGLVAAFDLGMEAPAPARPVTAPTPRPAARPRTAAAPKSAVVRAARSRSASSLKAASGYEEF